MPLNPTVKGYIDRASIYALDASGDFDLWYNMPPSAEAEQAFAAICATVPAQTVVERFAGIKGLGELALFTGNVEYSPVDNWMTTITSEEVALGVSMSFRDIVTDEKNLQKLAALPQQLAVQAQKRKFKNLATLLEANPVWGVDGENTFSDNHDFGDNNITVSGLTSATNPNEDDVIQILEAIRTQFSTYTNDHGVPLAEFSELTQLWIISKVPYQVGFNRVRRQMLIPRTAGSGAAAIDNVESSTFNYWGFQRLSTSANVLYAILVEPTEIALGNTPALVRTILSDYELLTNFNDGGSESFRNNRQIQYNVYGDEGLGVLNAARMMKVTLTT